MIDKGSLVFEKRDSHGSDAVVIGEILKDDVYRFGDRSGQKILDIGANIGVFTVLAALENDVEAYEPEPHNFERLSHHVAINNVSPVLHQKAVGKKGFAHIQDHGGGSKLGGDDGALVEVVSLNDIITSEIDFMKMDIEGSEFDAIFDATTDTLKKIKEFAMECHGDLTDFETYQRFIEKLLTVFDLEILPNLPFAGGMIYGVRR